MKSCFATHGQNIPCYADCVTKLHGQLLFKSRKYFLFREKLEIFLLALKSLTETDFEPRWKRASKVSGNSAPAIVNEVTFWTCKRV